MTTDVVLASLPFGILHSPSLALGLLQARLHAAGIRTTCRHFTLDYAAEVGVDVYSKIASGFPRTTDLLGEWIFSHALSPRTNAEEERYLARTFAVDGEPRAQLIDDVRQLAWRSGEFADFAAREILLHRPQVVGLTTVFQQNLATIAVASRIRQLDPSVKIVLGGANCESVMGQELARSYPFIDLVVSGEADLVIVPLVESLLAGEDPCTSARLRPLVDGSAAPRFMQTRIADLDQYVSPTFDDYFEDLSRLRDRLELTVELPLETSRGCWWGMKQHCTFCGLNGPTMAFRSRPPDQAFEEIVATATKHPGSKMCFVDNILDYRYYDRLLPKLAELGADLDLFYEIKSNVTRSQVQALKEAGVSHIQPGIESLSDQVLKIMKKGVFAIQNIQLLKWCAEYAIDADWNVLCGFPGEDPGEYERMAELVPLLCHLQPPARCSEIRVDRFSPNFTNAAELGFSNVRPYDAYGDVYAGASAAAVRNLAYFFAADGVARATLAGYTRSLIDAVDAWRRAYATSSLAYLKHDDRVVVVDSRAMVGRTRTVVLDGLPAKVFLLCDAARGNAALAAAVPESSPDEVAQALSFLCEQRLTWFDGARYLALPVSFTRFLESRATQNVKAAMDELLARPEPVT